MSIDVHTLRKYAAVLEAIEHGDKVEIAVYDDDDSYHAIVGFAREVVGRDTLYRASEWSDHTRLRVTTVQGMEAFIALRQIEEIHAVEDTPKLKRLLTEPTVFDSE